MGETSLQNICWDLEKLELEAMRLVEKLQGLRRNLEGIKISQGQVFTAGLDPMHEKWLQKAEQAKKEAGEK